MKCISSKKNHRGKCVDTCPKYTNSTDDNRCLEFIDLFNSKSNSSLIFLDSEYLYKGFYTIDGDIDE